MTGTPVQLTTGGMEKWNPTLTSDARRIVYVDGHDQGPDFSRDVFIIDADGQNGKQLSQHPGNLNYMPALSPDGQKIAYVSEIQGQGKADLYEMGLDGSQDTNITKDGGGYWEPQWSQDGHSILCTSRDSADGFSEVYLVAADGSRKTNLTQGHGNSHFARFAPDGQHIMFASDMNEGRDEMYSMSLDGSGITRLAPGVTVLDAPSASGQEIAFAGADDAQNEHLYEVPLSGATAATVVGTAEPISAAFSPDGQHIVYLADGAQNEVQLWEMSPDGSNVRALTTDKTFHIYPSYTPDGKAMVYAADGDNGSELYRIDLG